MICALPKAAVKRALLEMKAFYSPVIKGLQKMMLIEDKLLRTLTCLNPKEQKASNSLQHCRTVASEMPSVHPEEEVTAGDEWIGYQEFEVTVDDVKLRIDKLWHKIFSRSDASGDHFVTLPKKVYCALALCHSNADVERSLVETKEC